jgi:hypothetical protein
MYIVTSALAHFGEFRLNHIVFLAVTVDNVPRSGCCIDFTSILRIARCSQRKSLIRTS